MTSILSTFPKNSTNTFLFKDKKYDLLLLKEKKFAIQISRIYKILSSDKTQFYFIIHNALILFKKEVFSIVSNASWVINTLISLETRDLSYVHNS